VRKESEGHYFNVIANKSNILRGAEMLLMAQQE